MIEATNMFLVPTIMSYLNVNMSMDPVLKAPEKLLSPFYPGEGKPTL